MTTDPCTRVLVSAAPALAFALMSAPSAADGSSYGGSIHWPLIPVGSNVGAAIDGNGDVGLLLGGEASYVTEWDLASWDTALYGGYVDALWDRHARCGRVSIGPEVVLTPGLGFDAGGVLEFDSDRVRGGARLRYFAAFPLLMPYAATTWVVHAPEPLGVELGVLLKVPIEPD